MKKFGYASIAASGLAAGFLGLAAPAMAAPSGAGNAQDIISSLQDQGYKVLVNRLSNAPLAEANVVSVGKGPNFSHTDSNARNNQSYTDYGRQFSPVTTMTVYVTVK